MRILIYGINYTPELTGIGKYTGEMAEWLAANGHDIKIITAKPYYPEWEISGDYKKRIWDKQTINGVKVRRAPLYVPAKPSALKRIIHELSFQIGALPFWLSALVSKKYDAVLCITPAFHLGVYPLIYTRLRGSILWTHIQDLQVDAAKELKMINNERLLRWMFAAEGFLLRNSKVVSSISEGMIAKIKNKKIGDTPVAFFRNWVDNEAIRPLPKEQSLRKELGFSDTDTIVLYSGNLGEKQGLEIIIDVASRFSPDKNVRFLICGSGGHQDTLKAKAREANLANISFIPLQPYTKLAALLSMADMHLILQKQSASDLVMPSKLTSILASGGLAIVSAVEGTTLYSVVKEHHIGILIEPESVEALESGIRHAMNEACNMVIKQNARRYAETYLDKDYILSTFSQELQQYVQMNK